MKSGTATFRYQLSQTWQSGSDAGLPTNRLFYLLIVQVLLHARCLQSANQAAKIPAVNYHFFLNFFLVIKYLPLAWVACPACGILFVYYATPLLIGGGIKRWCCLTFVCLSCTSGLSREQRPRKTKIGTEVAHVTRDSDTTFRVKRSKVNVTRPLYSPPC